MVYVIISPGFGLLISCVFCIVNTAFETVVVYVPVSVTVGSPCEVVVSVTTSVVPSTASRGMSTTTITWYVPSAGNCAVLVIGPASISDWSNTPSPLASK